VCATVDKDLLDASIGEKFECVLDERGIREGQKTLACISMQPACYCGMPTLGLSSVKGLKRVSKGSASIWRMSAYFAA